MYKIFQYGKCLQDQIEAKSNTNVDKYSESPTIPYIYIVISLSSSTQI